MPHVMQVLTPVALSLMHKNGLLSSCTQSDLPVWANICRLLSRPMHRLCSFVVIQSIGDHHRSETSSIATNLVSGPLEPVLFSLDELNITLFVVECACALCMSVVRCFASFDCALLHFACKCSTSNGLEEKSAHSGRSFVAYHRNASPATVNSNPGTTCLANSTQLLTSQTTLSYHHFL